MSSGSYDLRNDLFDYYPPIQERVRWIIGAKDLADARKKLADYNMEGRATRIECPMLIGYSKDDRIMDPQGAFRLYKAATQFQARHGGRNRTRAGRQCRRSAAGTPAHLPGLGHEATGERVVVRCAALPERFVRGEIVSGASRRGVLFQPGMLRVSTFHSKYFSCNLKQFCVAKRPLFRNFRQFLTSL